MSSNGSFPVLIAAVAVHTVFQVEPLYAPKLLADGTAPIFSLSLVQFSLPGALLSLQVNSNTLAMAIDPLSLILIDLNRPAELVNVDLPRPAPDGRGSNPAIKELFGDPSGRHLLITVTTGDVFYVSTTNLAAIQAVSSNTARKARPLRLRHAVTCVAWTPNAPSATGTARTDVAECLLGSPDGTISTLVLPPSDDIFNLKSVSLAKTFERDHVDIFTFPDKDGVGGLSFGYWKDASIRQGSTKTAGEKRVWLLVSTLTRIYEAQATIPSGNVGWNMVGKQGWSDEMSRTLREHKPSPSKQRSLDFPHARRGAIDPASIESIELATAPATPSMLSSFWQTASPNMRKNSLRSVRQPRILARLSSEDMRNLSPMLSRSCTYTQRLRNGDMSCRGAIGTVIGTDGTLRKLLVDSFRRSRSRHGRNDYSAIDPGYGISLHPLVPFTPHCYLSSHCTYRMGGESESSEALCAYDVTEL